MEFTKWNVLEGLDSVEAVIELLLAACETPDDKEHIRHTLAVVMQAVKTYDLEIATEEEAADLAEDAALIKQCAKKIYAPPASAALSA